MADTTYLDPDDLPVGWRALCLSLDHDIAEMEKAGRISNFAVVQLKEKYGAMRMYYNVDGSDEALDALSRLVDDYEHISTWTCAYCGAFPSTRVTQGWILPVCAKCDSGQTESSAPFDPVYEVHYFNRAEPEKRDTSYLIERIARFS